MYNEYLKLFSQSEAERRPYYYYLENKVGQSTNVEEYIYWVIANSDIYEEYYFTIELCEKFYAETGDLRFFIIGCSLKLEFTGGFDKATCDKLYMLINYIRF